MSIDDILMSLSGAMPQAAVTGADIGKGPLFDPSVKPPVDDPAADVRNAYAGTYQPPAPQPAAPQPQPAAPADAPAPTEEQKAATQPATEVDGVTVTAKRTPKPVSVPNPLSPAQLDNSSDVGNAQDSLAKANLAAQGHPTGYAQGGSDNPGVFGMLPQGMQHGTLRNVIGALGDAFLVGSGRQAQYEPRMQRQSLGNAMAGLDVNNPDSVRAAATRMAVSGVPGATEAAQQLFERSAQLEQTKALREQTATYHQQQTDARRDTAIQRMTPLVGGMIQGATTKEAYAAAYQRAELMAQRLGPDVHASDFGIPNPEDWTPGMTATTGATTGQVMRRDTSTQSIDERRQAAAQSSSDRRRGQDMTSASSHYSTDHRTGSQMNATGLLRNLMAIPPAQRTPEQQDYVTRMTQPSARGRGGRGLPGSMGGPGGRPAPSPQQLLEVLKHPETAASFNAHFFGTH